MNPLYPAVAERARHRCEYCYAPEVIFNFTFEVEHVRPRSAGGDDTPDNVALACEACNLFKSNATTAWDEIKLRNVALFNPRLDRWTDHFDFDRNTAEIRGLTAIGRATIVRLRMNSALQLQARQYWMRLGLYP